MKKFFGILSVFFLVSCNEKIKNKSKEISSNLSDSTQTKSDSFYGMLVNSGTLADKCFDSFHSSIKYTVCIYYDNKMKFISTVDEKFITSDSVGVGMNFIDVELKSGQDLINEPGFANYFPLKSGWFAAFNLDKKTNRQTITKDSTVSFIFKRETR